MYGRHNHYREQYQCGNNLHVLVIKLIDAGCKRSFSNLGTNLETEEWVNIGNQVKNDTRQRKGKTTVDTVTFWPVKSRPTARTAGGTANRHLYDLVE